MILFISSFCFAQNSDSLEISGLKTSYAHEFNYVDRYSMSFDRKLIKPINMDCALFGFSKIGRDPFNNNKDNYSFLPIYSTILAFIPGCFSKDRNGLMESDYYPLYALPTLLTSTLYFIPLVKSSHGINPISEQHVDVFFKNDADYYAQHHPWFQTAPGLGLRYCNNKWAELVVCVGGERAFQGDLKGRYRVENKLYVKVAITPPME